MKILSGSVNLCFFRLKRKMLLGLALCMTISIASISAQEGGARIYHLEGSDFALTVQGERTIFPKEAVNSEGIKFERTGIVHTGPDTFLEIQLIPSETVIKMSENTSLVYNGIDATGGFEELGLLYGRIRVVTGGKMGASPVVIRSGGLSTRLESGDLGVDYVLEPGDRNAIPRPLFYIHAFRGSAEVFPYGRGGPQPYFGGAQVVKAEEGESLTLDISSAYTFAEKKSLNMDLADYWRTNNFNGPSPLPMPFTIISGGVPAVAVAPVVPIAPPVPAPAALPEPAAPTVSSVFSEPAEPEVDVAQQTAPSVFVSFDTLGQKPSVNQRTKNISIGIGLALTFISAVAGGYTYAKYDVSKDSTANNIFTAAQIPFGVGIITTLGGLLYNPSSSRK